MNMGIKKEIYKQCLKQLIDFLELDYEVAVYENETSDYIVNAFEHGQAIAQNGDVLLLLDEKMPPLVLLEPSIIKPLRELALAFGVNKMIDFLEPRYRFEHDYDLYVSDYLDVEDEFILYDHANNFELALSERSILEDISNKYLKKTQLLLHLFSSLKIKKLISISKIIIDLNDLNSQINIDEPIHINPDFANKLQEMLINNDEESCHKLLKQLNGETNE